MGIVLVVVCYLPYGELIHRRRSGVQKFIFRFHALPTPCVFPAKNAFLNTRPLLPRRLHADSCVGSGSISHRHRQRSLTIAGCLVTRLRTVCGDVEFCTEQCSGDSEIGDRPNDAVSDD